MKGFDNSTYVILFLIFNAIALLMFFTAWKAPKIARIMFAILFAWASWKNWTTAIREPNIYLDYANLTFSEVYKQFILGWFSRHIAVVVGSIATCQACIAVSMVLKGVIFKIGAIGAIVFLISIAPFGMGSAFPCTLIMAAALFVLLKKRQVVRTAIAL